MDLTFNLQSILSSAKSNWHIQDNKGNSLRGWSHKATHYGQKLQILPKNHGYFFLFKKFYYSLYMQKNHFPVGNNKNYHNLRIIWWNWIHWFDVQKDHNLWTKFIKNCHSAPGWLLARQGEGIWSWVSHNSIMRSIGIHSSCNIIIRGPSLLQPSKLTCSNLLSFML